MKAKTFLQQYGLRATRPRREIAAVITSLGRRHFSVEDVLVLLQRRKRTASRASTYRAINLFVNKGLLQAIDVGEGFQLYELASHKKHHDHLYCIGCGKIIEFEKKMIEELQVKVCKRNRFYPLSHTLRIRGLCDACRRKS